MHRPKKPNWDLKRDVEKKMTKLDYQTKSAIAQLIRQSLPNLLLNVSMDSHWGIQQDKG